MLEQKTFSEKIKNYALKIGFHACGISKANFLVEDAVFLKKWLDQDHEGEMAYMRNHFEKRTDPRLLVENAKSVISVLLNYFPEKQLHTEDQYKISKYAYGIDYHFVLKDKLSELLSFIEELCGKRTSRIFVDSAPVLDKRWAQKSGLGWIGKNTCLITKEQGSFFFIGEIIIDLDLDADEPIEDYCGSCTKCLNACPTNALVAPYRLDARKCISYLTIENKDEIPDRYKNSFNKWIYGCDICQDVCPWNKKAIPTLIPEFKPSDDLTQMKNEDWQNLEKGKFNNLFKNSAVLRTKFAGLKRNIKFVSD
ncbi:MAG: tRNA epoxyqueuosine(34) reductase QueG [Bacteroidetes bacterium HGW-Bacteroidetes-17]|jgi:epoxyqueuosine reductase|nr:MAG: tRNA epoxyqueuosine(34) reductase QueG [Bacteroidetes bacterium HGW-Bacteroidetes-17]